MVDTYLQNKKKKGVLVRKKKRTLWTAVGAEVLGDGRIGRGSKKGYAGV